MSCHTTVHTPVRRKLTRQLFIPSCPVPDEPPVAQPSPARPRRRLVCVSRRVGITHGTPHPVSGTHRTARRTQWCAHLGHGAPCLVDGIQRGEVEPEAVVADLDVFVEGAHALLVCSRGQLLTLGGVERLLCAEEAEDARVLLLAVGSDLEGRNRLCAREGDRSVCMGWHVERMCARRLGAWHGGA